MTDLIEKLERAQSFNRVLDGDIALHLGWTYEKMKGDRQPYWRKPDAKEYWERARSGPPEYTRSIDAALMLVPEGWAWFAQWIGGEFSEGDARLWIPSQRTQGLLKENFEARSCANPAIALCIAALKARVVLTSHKRGTE